MPESKEEIIELMNLCKEKKAMYESLDPPKEWFKSEEGREKFCNHVKKLIEYVNETIKECESLLEEDNDYGKE